jgi:hypothetical protein
VQPASSARSRVASPAKAVRMMSRLSASASASATRNGSAARQHLGGAASSRPEPIPLIVRRRSVCIDMRSTIAPLLTGPRASERDRRAGARGIVRRQVVSGESPPAWTSFCGAGCQAAVPQHAVCPSPGSPGSARGGAGWPSRKQCRSRVEGTPTEPTYSWADGRGKACPSSRMVAATSDRVRTPSFNITCSV